MPRAATNRSVTRSLRGGDGYDTLLDNMTGYNRLDSEVHFTNSSGQVGKDTNDVKDDVYTFLKDTFFPQLKNFTAVGDDTAYTIQVTARTGTPPPTFKVSLDTSKVRAGAPQHEGLAFAQYAVACITERLLDKTSNNVTVKFHDAYDVASAKITDTPLDAIKGIFSKGSMTVERNDKNLNNIDVKLMDGTDVKEQVELPAPRVCRQNEYFMILAFMMLTIKKYQDDGEAIGDLQDTLKAALNQLSAP